MQINNQLLFINRAFSKLQLKTYVVIIRLFRLLANAGYNARSSTSGQRFLNSFKTDLVLALRRRENEEVNCLVAKASGGEKARLSLAQIAAKTPKLLILDEVTNNLDLETRGHVIEVLKNYPGAMIVISHDADFLNEIGVNAYFKISDGYVSFSAR